jgi:hypothetical protein
MLFPVSVLFRWVPKGKLIPSNERWPVPLGSGMETSKSGTASRLSANLGGPDGVSRWSLHRGTGGGIDNGVSH